MVVNKSWSQTVTNRKNRVAVVVVVVCRETPIHVRKSYCGIAVTSDQTGALETRDSHKDTMIGGH